MKQIAVGTIGSGIIVRSILAGIAKTDGIRCEAVYSRTAQQADKLAAEYGIARAYSSMEEFLTDPAVAYVYIASPNSLHFSQAKAALEHGKHVLCEKPFTSTGREADILRDLARRNGLFLYEMVPTGFLPNFQILQSKLAQIGKPRLVIGNFSQYSSRYDQLLAGKVTNVFDPAFSGGCLQDINYYNVWLTVALFGKPERTAYYPNLHQNGIDISGAVTLVYPDFIATLAGAKDTWGKNFYLAEGEGGSLYGENGAGALDWIRLTTRAGETILDEQQGEDRWLLEVRHLTRVLQAEDYLDCEKRLERSQMVVETIEAARRFAGIRFPADTW